MNETRDDASSVNSGSKGSDPDADPREKETRREMRRNKTK